MAIRTLVSYAIFASALAAQTGSVAGPVSGYAFDSRSQSLRAIRGIPGAALIGDPVTFDNSVSAAWVSPGLDAALVVYSDQTAHLFRLDNGKATERTVEGLVAPERAVFSPSGTAMALVTPGSVRIYRGLPDTPQVAGTVELPADRVAAVMPGGKKRRPGGGPVAVSDDSQWLLYGNGDEVDLISVSGNSRKLTDAAANALPVFAPGGHDAAVLDANAVVFIQDVAGAATIRKSAGIRAVKDAAFSADGKRLFAAAGMVTAIDVASGEQAQINCDCRVSSLSRMGSAFRLNELGNGPLWVLDASSDPRVVFVPAAQ